MTPIIQLPRRSRAITKNTYMQHGRGTSAFVYKRAIFLGRKKGLTVSPIRRNTKSAL